LKKTRYAGLLKNKKWKVNVMRVRLANNGSQKNCRHKKTHPKWLK
jgi:hypothetical protein